MRDWDIYVFGDINIDLIVPGVKPLPEAGSEMMGPVMKT